MEHLNVFMLICVSIYFSCAHIIIGQDHDEAIDFDSYESDESYSATHNDTAIKETELLGYELGKLMALAELCKKAPILCERDGDGLVPVKHAQELMEAIVGDIVKNCFAYPEQCGDLTGALNEGAEAGYLKEEIEPALKDVDPVH